MSEKWLYKTWIIPGMVAKIMRRNTNVIALLLSIVLVGCMNQYAGKRPADQGPAIWRSIEPDIWFQIFVDDNGEKEPTGKLAYKGEVYELIVIFNTSDDVLFWDNDNQLLFLGTCKFSPSKLIVEIDAKYDSVFDGTVKEITFIKYENEK